MTNQNISPTYIDIAYEANKQGFVYEGKQNLQALSDKDLYLPSCYYLIMRNIDTNEVYYVHPDAFTNIKHYGILHSNVVG